MKKFNIAILLVIFAAIAISSFNQSPKESKYNMVDKQADKIFPKGNKISSNNFAGTVWLYMMTNNDSTLYAKMGHVTFESKARTSWHTHPGGQILLITNGVGYYQEKGKPAQLLHTGDFVEIPPNTVHWHGAGPDSEFAHIAISLNTDEGGVVWLQPVTEKEYSQATK